MIVVLVMVVMVVVIIVVVVVTTPTARANKEFAATNTAPPKLQTCTTYTRQPRKLAKMGGARWWWLWL